MIKREDWDLKQLKATKEKYQRQLARVDQLKTIVKLSKKSLIIGLIPMAALTAST